MTSFLFTQALAAHKRGASPAGGSEELTGSHPIEVSGARETNVYVLTGARYDAADSLTHVEMGFINWDSTDWLIRPHVTEASVITLMLSAGRRGVCQPWPLRSSRAAQRRRRVGSCESN